MPSRSLRLALVALVVTCLVPFALAFPGSGGQAAPSVEGTVLETMNSGGYTYVRLETPGGEVWAAGPLTEVAVGDRVALGPGSPMTAFRSESLGRTFDTILFVSAIRPSGAGSDGADAAVASAHAGSVRPAEADVQGVAKADGGLTVAELWAARTEIAGKPVVVRGRVVKFNSGILGRNWIHIQDGTGADGTHDLTVTTDARAKVGDVVLVRGTAATDRDFGMGYRYDLIVEEADVTVE